MTARRHCAGRIQNTRASSSGSFPGTAALARVSAAIGAIARFKKEDEEMLTIHGVPISVHTRKVIVTAIEKQLQFRVEPVIPFTPPAGWSDLSPTRKIPVIIDGDFTLRDSAAICAYLERMHPSTA